MPWSFLSPSKPNPPADPLRPVFSASNESSFWFLEVLSDRWGNFFSPAKGGELDDDAVWRLRGQMWDEITFAAKKDGVLGVLFEVDFCSRESEEAFFRKRQTDDLKVWYSRLPCAVDIYARLLGGMAIAQREFPRVSFCVPAPERKNDRPLAWAFVPDGMLESDELHRLGGFLLRLMTIPATTGSAPEAAHFEGCAG